MRDRTLYVAGDEEANLSIRFRVHAGRYGLTDTARAGTARFWEFWCQKHCRGLWRVVETCETIMVAFESRRDTVLWALSDECGRFTQRPEVVLETPLN